MPIREDKVMVTEDDESTQQREHCVGTITSDTKYCRLFSKSAFELVVENYLYEGSFSPFS